MRSRLSPRANVARRARVSYAGARTIPRASALEHAASLPLVVADAHVHVHACYDPARFFDHAHRNLSRAAAAAGANASGPRSFHAVLLLSEAAGENYFDTASTLAAAGRCIGRWMPRATSEPEALRLISGDDALVLIAGRQIACVEDLEVLALATSMRIDDGHPIREVLARTRAAGALPVVPWGAGKWLFGRGRLLDALLREAGDAPLFLGDESARPVFWPTPRHFADAAVRGIRNLPGTDPLPFASEEHRAGSYGFTLAMAFDPGRPALSLREALIASAPAPVPFGRRESMLRFVRNQWSMQQRKRARRGTR